MSIEQHTIKQASAMRSGINVVGTVTGLEEPRTLNLKSGGTLQKRDVTLTDDTGSIILSVWGEDIEKVKKGSEVEIVNGYTNIFKGNVSLTKGKFGQLKVL